ncbi:MAG: hypothetical protein NWP36_07570 [Paracoccaceae bacterium]|nr:hypothetical protein [Paracoccaceae bacterium]
MTEGFGAKTRRIKGASHSDWPMAGGCVIAVYIYMPPLAIVIYLSLLGALG